jgi:hypothetical protein
MAQNHRDPIGGGIVLALLLLPLGINRNLRKRLNGRMLLLFLLLAGTTAAMSGCGGIEQQLLDADRADLHADGDRDQWNSRA